MLLLQWIHCTEDQCYCCSGFTAQRASVFAVVDSPHRGPVLVVNWIHHTEGQCFCCSVFTAQRTSVIVAVGSPHRGPVFLL